MCAIQQLAPAQLNPISIVEHFRMSRPQCEHSHVPDIELETGSV